jgi:hypothetical protein
LQRQSGGGFSIACIVGGIFAGSPVQAQGEGVCFKPEADWLPVSPDGEPPAINRRIDTPQAEQRWTESVAAANAISRIR